MQYRPSSKNTSSFTFSDVNQGDIIRVTFWTLNTPQLWQMMGVTTLVSEQALSVLEGSPFCSQMVLYLAPLLTFVFQIIKYCFAVTNRGFPLEVRIIFKYLL